MIKCLFQENLPSVARFGEKLPKDFVFLAYYDKINLALAKVATLEFFLKPRNIF